MDANALARTSEAAGANVNPAVAEPDATALAREVVAHICGGRLDEAEGVLAQLHERCPASRDVLAFPVMIALQRGRAHEAWQLVNGLPDEQCPDLKALCLRMLGDPLWHAYASAHVDSADPWVRKAMRQLLGHESDEPADDSREAASHEPHSV
ncbi:hypothetical protein FAZ98_28590 [Paraburkholderia acidisoli]|uniref:Type III secretion protein HrpB1 n=2 Tax=Paraburkholderia acidisoli TaxID=2571748 RepID=A0A7Z2JJI6_9BURK|nr:hypothetical protein FAZ98_28590 [Paraburkholderia acidisoli]